MPISTTCSAYSTANGYTPGSVVVADNVLLPGAPRYRAFTQAHNGRLWDTTEHRTHLEYQSLLGDLVLESRFLGG